MEHMISVLEWLLRGGEKMEHMISVLEWLLRGFGLFWIFGGYLTFREAKSSKMMDQVLAALDPVNEPSSIETRFLYLSTLFTTLSGAFLAAGSRWAWIPVGLLVSSQLIYFLIQNHRYQHASSDEAREDAALSPKTKNAFVVSLVVWVGSLTLFG